MRVHTLLSLCYTVQHVLHMHVNKRQVISMKGREVMIIKASLAVLICQIVCFVMKVSEPFKHFIPVIHLLVALFKIH